MPIVASGYKCLPKRPSSTGCMIQCMDRFVVVHYHEVGLKKGNRDYFENRLCANIRRSLNDVGATAGEVRRISGRILVQLPDSANMALVQEALRRVFGISYFAEAWNSAQSF